MSDTKRRLALALYRNMLRATSDINPKIPLRPMLPLSADPILVDTITNVNDLEKCIRIAFRKNTDRRDEQLKEAVRTLRQLYELKEKLKFFRLADVDEADNKPKEAVDVPPEDDSWTSRKIDKVSWLPVIEKTPSSSSNHVDNNTILPLFPLSGPMYSPTGPLPRFSSFSDIPTPGMLIDLKIFEPRYRQLYNDLIVSGSRKFVVPFAHPTIPGKFASIGLLFEIMQVKEVADETNGQVQYLCNHLVTKPVKMKAIINPEVWSTQETYLKIAGEVIEEDLMTTKQLEPLVATISKWNSVSDHPLAKRLLEGVQIDGIWGFVCVWVLHVQQELFQMQVGIAAEVKLRSTMLSDDASLLEVQAPHRERLLSLKLDVSLLVPTLLAMDNDGKTNHLVSLVEAEQKRLEDLSIVD
jgi:hypothetical protein